MMPKRKTEPLPFSVRLLTAGVGWIFLILIGLTLEYFYPVCGVQKWGLFDSYLTPHRCLTSARWIFGLALAGMLLHALCLLIRKAFFWRLLLLLIAALNTASILLPLIGTGACKMPSMVCRAHSFPMTHLFSALSLFWIVACLLWQFGVGRKAARLQRHTSEFTEE